MALVECHECKKQISSEAIICPHCGYCAKKARTQRLPFGISSSWWYALVFVPVFIYYLYNFDLSKINKNIKTYSIPTTTYGQIEKKDYIMFQNIIKDYGLDCVNIDGGKLYSREGLGTTFEVYCNKDEYRIFISNQDFTAKLIKIN